MCDTTASEVGGGPTTIKLTGERGPPGPPGPPGEGVEGKQVRPTPLWWSILQVHPKTHFDVSTGAFRFTGVQRREGKISYLRSTKITFFFF